MDQGGKCFLWKHKDLSSSPQNTWQKKKNLSWALISASDSVRKPYLKEKKMESKRRKICSFEPGLHIYTYMCTHIYISANILTWLHTQRLFHIFIQSIQFWILLVRIYMYRTYVWALQTKNGQDNNKIIKIKTTTNKALSDLFFTTTKIWK